MSNPNKGKKRINSSKDLHLKSVYQEKYDKYETKQQKKEHQHQQIQSLQNLGNDSQTNNNGVKQTKEEISKQFPNKMMAMLTQQFKKLEQSTSNLKLLQIQRDLPHPDINLNSFIVQFHKEIYTQYANYQFQQDQALSESIRGNPEKNLQMLNFGAVNMKMPNPFQQKIQSLEQLCAKLE